MVFRRSLTLWVGLLKRVVEGIRYPLLVDSIRNLLEKIMLQSKKG
jgi:hypothetical protein